MCAHCFISYMVRNWHMLVITMYITVFYWSCENNFSIFSLLSCVIVKHVNFHEAYTLKLQFLSSIFSC